MNQPCCDSPPVFATTGEWTDDELRAVGLIGSTVTCPCGSLRAFDPAEHLQEVFVSGKFSGADC